MNVGQNGDPDDCVRSGYLWGLNGGEAALLGGLSQVKRVLTAHALMSALYSLPLSSDLHSLLSGFCGAAKLK